jgi:hypothetical protein
MMMMMKAGDNFKNPAQSLVHQAYSHDEILWGKPLEPGALFVHKFSPTGCPQVIQQLPFSLIKTAKAFPNPRAIYHRCHAIR